MKQTDSQEDRYEEYVKTYAQNGNKTGKIIGSILRGNVWQIVKATFFLLIRQTPVLVLPIVTANIINVATNPGDYKITALLISGGIGLFFLAQNVWAAYVQTGIYSKVTRGIERNLRGTMVRRLQQLSISFCQSMQSGRILSKIMRDVENVEMLLRQGYLSLFTSLLYIIFALVVTAGKSPAVLVFFLLTIPAAVLTMRLFRKPIRKRNFEFRSKMEETQASMAEMVELLPVTRAHGLGQVEVNKIDGSLEKIYSSGRQLDVLNEVFGATSWVVFQAFGLFCLVFTGAMAFTGKITVGEVVLYQTYFGQIVGQVGGLMSLYPILTKGLESVRSIGDIIAATDVERGGGELPLDELKGEVEFDKVDYHYPHSDNEVLHDFSLHIDPGECVAFVGGSGAGKTTLLNLLIGFYEPQSGQIRIDGKPLEKIDLNAFRAQIAVVPQNTILFSGTLYDNITYGIEGVSEAAVRDVIDKVGLSDFVARLPKDIHTKLEENGSNLSGGQKQRISIARALVRKPKLIIFDEATSALDSASEQKVQRAVDYMMKQCTIFMVAHRLSTVKNADRIVVLAGGHVQEAGNYDELMRAKGAFYNMKRMQE